MSETRVGTIGDLRRLLERVQQLGLTDDVVVIMARDEEGNSFSPLAEATYSEAYVAESTYSGYLEHWDEDDCADAGEERLDYEDWLDDITLTGGAVRCLVLWPTN